MWRSGEKGPIRRRSKGCGDGPLQVVKKLKNWTWWQKISFVSCKSWKDKSIKQQNLQIIGGMQPNYLGDYTPHPPQVCTLLSLTSGGRKIKDLNLMTEVWICVMQKLEEETIIALMAKMLRRPRPPLGFCYHWLQVVEILKELNLMTKHCLCIIQKLGEQKH